MNKDHDSFEYRGPGRITSALGRSSVNQFIGGLAGAAGGATLGALSSKVSKLNGAVVGAYVVAIPAGLYGLYQGWRNSARAQRDHSDLLHENKLLKEKISWTDRMQEHTASKDSPER